MIAKQAAAQKAIEYIKDGMTVGLGTGSTAFWVIQYLAQKIKSGMKITAVATSKETEKLAAECGIPITEMDAVDHIDIDIDGADEVDAGLNLVKGGGGALLREKIVSFNSSGFIVVVDESKMVDTLGKFPLPVEVIPFGWEHTARHLALLGCTTMQRKSVAASFITDNGNYILDCHFKLIPDPALLQAKINAIPGVVESGLFVKMATRIIVGYNDGKVEEYS